MGSFGQEDEGETSERGIRGSETTENSAPRIMETLEVMETDVDVLVEGKTSGGIRDGVEIPANIVFEEMLEGSIGSGNREDVASIMQSIKREGVGSDMGAEGRDISQVELEFEDSPQQLVNADICIESCMETRE